MDLCTYSTRSLQWIISAGFPRQGVSYIFTVVGKALELLLELLDVLLAFILR